MWEASLFSHLCGFDCEEAQREPPGAPKQGRYPFRASELYRGTLFQIGAAEFLETMLTWWLMAGGP